MRLDNLPLNTPANITQIDWLALGEAGARRLKGFGFEPGIAIESIHTALGKGPIALRIGRMTVALRRDQAAAVSVAIL